MQALASNKGLELSEVEAMDYAAYKERQYDRLAEILRQHIDMKRIYEIMDEGV